LVDIISLFMRRNNIQKTCSVTLILIAALFYSAAEAHTIHFEHRTPARVVSLAQTQIPENTNFRVAKEASEAVVMVRGYKETPVYGVHIEDLFNGILNYIQIGTANEQVSSGSGFFITENGYLLTNKHVVEDTESEYMVRTDTREVHARVIYRDPDYDLAVLKIEGENYQTIPLASTIEVGEQIVTIGNALGRLVDSVSEGMITGLNQRVRVSNPGHEGISIGGLIETNAKLYPGDSGGPLLNADGQAIGVNVATALGVNMSYAIPASIADLVLKRAGIVV
jgi:S1-C subfamily serine protease